MPDPADQTTADKTVQPPGQSCEKSALTNLRSHLILWISAGVGLALDLVTKKWALAALAAPDPFLSKAKVIIPGYLRFQLVENPGAVAGVAAGHTSLLIFVSLAALVFLFWLFVCSKAKQWAVHLGLGMLVAGALGNTYDRIFNDGRVIDFIEVDLHFRPANPWPTFNVADMLLCLGVFIVLITVVGKGKESGKAASTPAKPKD